MSLIVDGTTGVTFNDSSLQGAAASPYVLKNRIINGAMVIDQRNAGASVTPTASSYTLDRWRAGLSVTSKFSVQQSSTAPAGFNNSLLVTSLSAYTVASNEQFQISQRLEGYNIADFGWGTANAQTVTLSFWVRSSLTGTFGGALRNGNSNRSYPYSYTISSANTWEYKTITISGETTGTWFTTNGVGLSVFFGLGIGSTLSGPANVWASTEYASTTGATNILGTNGATWYLTGVQLEVGSTATPFERRLYGQELINCQRYYAQSEALSSYNSGIVFTQRSTSNAATYWAVLPVQTKMRTTPTVTLYSYSGTVNKLSDGNSGAPDISASIDGLFIYNMFCTLGLTSSSTTALYANFTANAEL